MGVGSTDLTEALVSLQRAAEAAFSGNDYYRVANEIDEMLDLAGPRAPVSGEAGAGLPPDFPSMLAKVRVLSQAQLAGNPYYLVLQKLDNLSMIASHVTALAKTARGPSFDDLAAASKARVDALAAGLGLSRPRTVTVNRVAPETLADGELERRSSEPCLAAEFEERRLGEVGTVFVSEGGAGGAPAKGAGAARSPAANLERNAGAGASASGAAREAEGAAFAQDSAPARDPTAAAAGETVGAQAAKGSRKSLFGHWLDAVFGRGR